MRMKVELTAGRFSDAVLFEKLKSGEKLPVNICGYEFEALIERGSFFEDACFTKKLTFEGAICPKECKNENI